MFVNKFSLLLTSLFFVSFLSATNAFNITEILNQYPDFSKFNDYLTQSQVANVINTRQSITVLVVDNGNIGQLSGQQLDALRKILSVHVILDYFDVQKLQNLQAKTAIVTTLFQASGLAVGQEGFLNVTILGTGNVAFGSAVPGSTLNSNLVKSVSSQPYNISVLQISNVISVPGVGNGGSASPGVPTPTNPPGNNSPTPGASPTSPPGGTAPTPPGNAPVPSANNGPPVVVVPGTGSPPPGAAAPPKGSGPPGVAPGNGTAPPNGNAPPGGAAPPNGNAPPGVVPGNGNAPSGSAAPPNGNAPSGAATPPNGNGPPGAASPANGNGAGANAPQGSPPKPAAGGSGTTPGSPPQPAAEAPAADTPQGSPPGPATGAGAPAANAPGAYAPGANAPAADAPDDDGNGSSAAPAFFANKIFAFPMVFSLVWFSLGMF